jgi:hypothetical protein
MDDLVCEGGSLELVSLLILSQAMRATEGRTGDLSRKGGVTEENQLWVKGL